MAALIASAGCGTTVRLNGTYVGLRPFKVSPGQDPFVVKQLATVELIVKPDGTAELSDAGIPVEGHIEYGGNDATFVPDAIAGVGVYKQDPSVVARYRVALTPKGPDAWVYRDSLVLNRKPPAP